MPTDQIEVDYDSDNHEAAETSCTALRQQEDAESAAERANKEMLQTQALLLRRKRFLRHINQEGTIVMPHYMRKDIMDQWKTEYHKKSEQRAL